MSMPFWRRMIGEFLCLAGIGLPSLERFQEIFIEGQEDAFKEWKLALFNRIANVNVVSALLFSAITTLITTSPPTGMLRWDRAVPYITMLFTLLLSALGLCLGVATMFVLSDIQPPSVRTLAKQRIKFRITVCFLAAPLLLVIASGMTASVALVCAAWLGDNIVVKAFGTMAIMIMGLSVLTVALFVQT